jgi:hypothetical protein
VRDRIGDNAQAHEETQKCRKIHILVSIRWPRA